jgi:1-acyl-sn-glycerol-3-phosphate acyltransferase
MSLKLPLPFLPTDNPSVYQGWSLEERDPQIIQAWMPIWEALYHYYFRVQTCGWEHIPTGNALYVGSHNGGLASPDLPMFMVDWFRRVGYTQSIYALMHPKVWQIHPQAATLATQMGAIQAHPKMAMAALQAGASVLVYPGGPQDVFRSHRLKQKIHFVGRTGFIKLALREGVPIVPLISWGAHDTFWVIEDCYGQAKSLNQKGLLPWLWNIDPETFPIYVGLPWGLGIGPLPHLPWPMQIHTQICPVIEFERYGREAANDSAYVEACYHQVVNQMQQALDALAQKVTT